MAPSDVIPEHWPGRSSGCKERVCSAVLQDELIVNSTGPPLVVLSAFRIVDVGHPIPSEIDREPCPQGEWQQALYAATASRRVGTVYGCGLAIQKANASGRDPAWIRQTAREHFVLPRGSITATCAELFMFSRDQHHSRATFRCRIDGGGTISGSGPTFDACGLRTQDPLALRRLRSGDIREHWRTRRLCCPPHMRGLHRLTRRRGNRPL
jgi:hypothetical protein